MTRLRRIPSLILKVFLSLTLGLMALSLAFLPVSTPLLAAPAAQEDAPAITGYYQSEVIPGQGDFGDLVVGLILFADGSAEVISNYQNGERIITEFATWVDNGDETVTVIATGTPEETYATPYELRFEVAEDGTLAIPGTANSVFGEAGLSLAPTPFSQAILAQVPSNALVYQSDVLTSTATSSFQLILTLFDDNSLRLVSDFTNDDENVYEVGNWTEGGDGGLVINLTGQIENGAGALITYDDAPQFVFTVNDDDSLALVDEGGALFGEQGLTLAPIDASAVPGDTEASDIDAGEVVSDTDASEVDANEVVTDTAAEGEATDEEATEGEEVAAAADVTETATITGAGAYISTILPSTEMGDNFLVMVLGENGSFHFTTYAINGDRALMELGTWASGGDDTYTATVTGTVESAYESPVPVDFTIDEDGVIDIAGVKFYPVDGLDLVTEPALLAEFQSGPITNTVDISHTLTLEAYDDSTATVITDYEDGTTATQSGEWAVDEATDIFTLTLTRGDDGALEEPVVWTFDIATDESLVLSNDVDGYYGEDGLTLTPVVVEVVSEGEGELAPDDATAPDAGSEAVGEAEAGAETDSASEEPAEEATVEATEEESDSQPSEEITATQGIQIFQSDVLPAASSPGLQLTLGLADDGSAAIDYDYMNDEEVITNTGEWIANDDGSITVTFTEGPNGELDLPVELTLELDNDGNLVITEASEESLGFVDVALAPVAPE